MTPRPPRLAERLVTWSLFPPDREAVLGDLQEEFAAVSDARGDDAAWRWYWTQTLASVGPNVLRRIHGSYELRRLAESDSDRLMRKSIRTFSLWLLAAPIALGLFVWTFGRDLSYAIAFGGVSVGVGIPLLLSTLLPTRPVDRATGIANVRRMRIVSGLSLVIWGTSSAIWGPRHHQVVRELNETVLLLALAVLAWPKNRWPIRLWHAEPESPRAHTPFVIGAGADGPIFLTVDVPQQPANVGNLILARGARIVIDRVFGARGGLRVFAIVNGGTTAAIDLLEGDSHVVRTMNAPLERAAWSSDHASQLDVTVPLDQLAAGSYRLRVSVADGPDIGIREAAFHIRA